MGWSELILVGVVALIVVGPKDLPVLFQSLGKMTAKVRRMAREFQTAMRDAAESTGANDIAGDLKGLTSGRSLGIDALKDAAESFDKWEPTQPRVMGSETAKLTQERAEAARKIREAAAKKAQARLDREAAEAEGVAEPAAKIAGKPAAPRKPAAKKTTAKKSTAAKNTGAKKTSGSPSAKPTKQAAKKPATKAAPVKEASAKPASRRTPKKSASDVATAAPAKRATRKSAKDTS